jgi:hypothetical protein
MDPIVSPAAEVTLLRGVPVKSASFPLLNRVSVPSFSQFEVVVSQVPLVAPVQVSVAACDHDVTPITTRQNTAA